MKLYTCNLNSTHLKKYTTFPKMADIIVNDLNKQQLNTHGSKKSLKKEAFTVDFGNDSKASLQESFLRFKKARQKEIAKRKKVRRARLKRQKNPRYMEELRAKFINQAKKYFGVPYARKYWSKETEEYSSKIFLDCCGLVRQIVRDLASDFGFVIGPWNQAYMFDTLPKTVESEKDMKPGDLVFMSGTYTNPNSRNQKHFMTHVEIWLGEGPKTIGARWNNGKVQIFDHYKFEAKSFTNTVYYFKSIDTWLKGICKSFCPDHKWKRSKFKPGKKSIFLDKKQKKDNKEQEKQQAEEPVQEQADEAADEPGDEPDDYPDDGQVDDDDEDQDQDDLDDDDLVDDENQEPDDDDDLTNVYGQEQTTPTPPISIHSYSAGHKKDVTKNSLTSLSSCPEKLCLTVNNGSLTNILNSPLQEKKSNLPHTLNGEKKDCGGEKLKFESSLKAGCDKSANANGNDKEAFIDNESDDDSLSIRLRDTSLHSESSIATDSTDLSAENNGKETEEKAPRRGKKSPASRATKLPQCSLPTNMQPTFYIGGGNGVSLVEGPLLALGWKRTTDKYDERYRLKWVECKTRINYGGFKEGDQLVNHIPNGQLLTNKLGLLNSLQEYERVTLSTKGRPPRLKFIDFFPETYRLDEKSNKDVFLDIYQDGELWICKPTGLNQGKGIFIIRNRDEINRLLEEREQKKEQMSRSTKPLMSRIVQRYIMNPLLLTGRKFDIRAYMLIASTVPFLVLYHKGYVRLCCQKYDTDDQNLSTHLTNQYVQKKDPNFKDIKEDTVWSMEKFNDYFNDKFAAKSGVEPDWVKNGLTKQMQKIMIHCFNSVKHKLNQRIGYFDLFGLDFMVDTDLKVWLIEVNVNPSLAVTCAAQKEVVPGVVEEALYLSIECFEKTRKNQPLLPLNTLKNFAVLYCGTRPNTLPLRPARSVSPVKDEKVKTMSPNSTAISRPRKSIDQGRSGNRMSISSTSMSTGVKKQEQDNSKTATTKSTENPLKASNSDSKLQTEGESSVALKMTHVNSSEAIGAKSDIKEPSNDPDSDQSPKSVWTLGSNGVLTLKSPDPSPVTQTVTTTPNLDQIKSILAQIGTTSATNSNGTNGKPVDVSSGSQPNDAVVPEAGEINSNEIVPSEVNVSKEQQREKSSTSLPRSSFPSLISSENMKSASAVSTGLNSSGKLASCVSSSPGVGVIAQTSQSAPRSVPITTFSLTNVNSDISERNRAETMAAYTTLSKLNGSNLPSISQTNSVVKTQASVNPNVRLSNVYKTTTNLENSPSLKFTSVGQVKQPLASETHIEVIPHKKHRDFERGS